MRSMEPSPTENIIFSDPIIELGGSDSGTELSISSTLDSPDRPEVGIVYFGKEASMANLINRSGSMDDTFNLENLDIDYVESGSLQVVHRRSVDSIVAIKCSPVAQIHKDAKSDKDPHRLSTDEYFKRHTTESESQTAPSRKTPSKGNRSRLHRSESAQNSKWQTVRKQSPPQPNHVSSGRKSTEKLRKDQNNWNRRISFGSEKADNADQEQRGRSSTQSVPSYMQATESARAKAHTNSSARPSTDGGQANADYVKKPNLLSCTNVKQSSPCKQRSVPYSEEGTTVHHGGSHREKWQR
ncbi:hypothetical protein Syun_015566 [Stephania yunnanensis]|uniref:Uncharacterized protein n=1 Tax=Stephania yunnanensis TaxID=152371 RepID=A0AAP0JLE9_9MAGN